MLPTKIASREEWIAAPQSASKKEGKPICATGTRWPRSGAPCRG
jgi:hypothetical protein